MTDKWDPEDYHKHSYPQYAFALGLVKRLELRGHERILDIGCGDGKITAELAARVSHGSVLGIDNSAEMILFAQNMFPRSVYPNLSFRLGDAVNLTFSQEFDVIVAFASLHWTADLATVLQGIKSSLAPGGRFAAQLMAKRFTKQEKSGSPLHQARREVMARPVWRPFFRGFKKQGSVYSADEYEKLLRDAGFTPYRVEFVTEDVTHPGKAALKGCARATWHRYTSRIPAEHRDAFLDEVVQRFIEQYPPDRGGQIHVHMKILEVEATVTGD
ncbi:MAG: class I SAM-dependent methyltransferase [Halobacteriota archaeon]